MHPHRSPLTILLVFALFVPLSLVRSQTTFQWNGNGVDDNFTTAANWTNGVAPSPSATNDYVFSGSTRLNPSLTGGSYFVNTITFGASAGAFTIGGDATSSNNRFQAGTNLPLTVSQLSSNDQRIDAILLASGYASQFIGNGTGNLTIGGLRQEGAGGNILLDRNVTFTTGFMTAANATNQFYYIGTSKSANATFSSDPFNQIVGGRYINMGWENPALGLNSTLTVAGDFTTAGELTVRGGFGGTNGTATISGTGAATFSSLTFLFNDNVNRTLRVDNTSAAGTTISGGVVLGGNTAPRTNTFDIADNSKLTLAGTVWNGVWGQVAGLVKSGGGTMTLSGYNNYSGQTTVAAGTLIISNGDAIRDTTAVVMSNAAGANLRVNSSEIIGSLRGGGASGGNVAIASSQTLTVAETNSQTFAGVISGAGGLTKSSAGTLTLSGVNTYSGATRVSGGRLVVDGSINNSTVTVSNSATLSGSGSVGGIVINTGGTVNPGNSPGTLNVAGNVTWNGGGNYNWQIFNASGIKGSTNGWDWLNASGALDLSSLSVTNQFNINLWSLSGISPDTNGSAVFFTNTSNYTWTILTASNGIAGFSADKFLINTAAINGAGGFANALDGGSFSMVQSGNNLNLVFTAAAGVPEPGTWAAAALLIGAAGYVRWRKRAEIR